MNIQAVTSMNGMRSVVDVVSNSNKAEASAPTPIGNNAPPVERQGTSSLQQVQEAVQKTNDFIRPFNGALRFEVEPDTNETIVKIIDQETKEVVKQIPSEEMINLAKALDQLKGLLVKQQA